MTPTEIAPWLALLNSIGVGGIVAIIAYAFFKRKVRTAGEVDDTVKMYETRLAEEREEKNEWKASAMKQADTNTSLAEQLSKVTDIVETLTVQRSPR